MTGRNSGFSEASIGAPANSFDQLCFLAARLLNIDHAAVVLSIRGVSQLVAGYGLPIAMRSVKWDLTTAPYKSNENYILRDVRQNAYVERVFHEVGLSQVGGFIRLALDVADDYVLSLLLFSDKPITKPDNEKLKVIAEIGAALKEELKQSIADIVAPHNDITVAKTLDDIKNLMQQSQRATFLYNADLKLIAVNAAAESLFDFKAASIISKTHKAIANNFSPITVDTVKLLFRKALNTLTSPPFFEVVSDFYPGRIFEFNVTPFSPVETRDYFLLVSIHDKTKSVDRAQALEAMIEKAHPLPVPKDPSQLFLTDTLVRRRSIRQRKQTNFVVLRAWRQSIKPYQISAFKALKQNIPSEFLRAIAEEVATEIESLFGVSGFKAIVPIPCGHSKTGTCLSVEIARALGAITGLPVIQAFLNEQLPGVSHPKQNAKRPKMKMLSVINEPVLLIDDIATSGVHIEEAVALLKPTCGAVLPIAWLGGDVAEDGD